jgi:chromosome segregation protein
MLKALELHGFKSFADKTRFEFPPGITVVVGPNGSGKSNVVDAVKWVLGEQSAKSLRGKEMSDVIFKGSGTSGRKPMNTAEATLVFDNADRRLPVDAPEVHITRRVYRSGEGEYLINRQPARLKDIRDLFRGTGVGVDAYSLIEQGKVDRLLQASAKDRRAIFEEAAGISRFKAKKVEAQRRLERVDQNLLRLTDIVEEVENRLKAVRAQASKARRYREYTQRLQELRTQIALVDWRRLTDQIVKLEIDLAGLAEEIASSEAEGQRLEAGQLEFEAAAASAGEELRNCDNRIALARQQLAQHFSTIEHERSRLLELEEEQRLHGRNLLAMSDRAGDARTRLKATQAEVAAAEMAHETVAEELAGRESRLEEAAQHLERCRRQGESRRQEYVMRLQAAASLASQVESGQSQLAAVQQAVLQQQRQFTELTASETALTEQLAAARQREQSLREQLVTHQERVESATNELAENRNLYNSRSEDLSLLHGRRRGVAERAEVLEEFERTLEGLGNGVKQVLARAGVRVQETGDGGQEPGDRKQRHPWSLVRGVVADFVQVGVEHAAAIDVALGDAAQWIVVDGGPDEIAALIAAADNLTGRVVAVSDLGSIQDLSLKVMEDESSGPNTEYSVLSTQHSEKKPAKWRPSRATLSAIELTAEMVGGVRVIARADKLIDCQERDRPLVTALLGRTFVVHSLADALRLRAQAPAEARVVTLDGELVEERGAVAFGPRQTATSLVSRRSQLRAARLDLAVLDQQIADASRETQHLKREIERHEQTLQQLAGAARALDQQLLHEEAATRSLGQQLTRITQQRQTLEESLAAANERGTAIEATLKQASQDLAIAQAAAVEIQALIAGQDDELAELDRTRQAAAAEVTSAKVELARADQRVESLRLRLTQFEDDHRDRERAIGQVRAQLRQARQRGEAAELATLAASAAVALLAIEQQSLARQMEDCAVRREAALAERGRISDQLAGLRRRTQKLRDQQHQLELSAEQIRHERRSLADRLREDYGIDLAAATDQPSPQEAEERAAAHAEIESLRRKINQIGAVNLDALEELDELEQRFATLSGQHKDLTEAKQSLERIIHKINADSRRLFLETLEAIRVNFQALYRKAFGGGKADIVLEEGVDVLDCGVEIIATPPGKPSFNNSLLSGGEKALTAVALLLAIFQFRPSPFCVLDEVDAPFDEANIGRFMDVLKDFLSWTRFILVTHSKKTMTAATTLYGVTMQESGVSKRVSVRFEDVTDDGHIRREALDRDAGEEAA